MSNGAPLTVLAVDDNEAVRYSLARCLREGGYTVLEARNGKEALELACNKPDLITLDVNLPDMDGFAVCRKLKADPVTAQIPVLHISASFSKTEDRVRGLEGGADAYLTAPVNRHELLATVQALFRLRNAERESRHFAAEAEKAKEALKRINEELAARVQERTAELERRNSEIQDLSRRLLRVQDDERRRISRELHDSTGQLLVSLKLNLAVLANSQSAVQKQALIEGASAMVDEMTRQLRTMSYLLHPPLLDEAGLGPALKWYVEGFCQRSEIAVQLDLPADVERLARDMELTIFRVVQESLTNVHRHSQSRTAQVKLKTDAACVFLEITDQGTGFPVSSRSGATNGGAVSYGIGIRGMRERIQQFDGELQVTSGPSGTSLRAVLPKPVMAVGTQQTNSSTQCHEPK
jgi:signal transduction histidine kinase